MRALDKQVIHLRGVHETAIVYPGAQLGKDVEIGPFSIIGENVIIDDGTKVGAHVVIDGWTTIGKNCRIYTGACIGHEPQDMKFRGEKSYLVIGDGAIIREYATIERGTEGGGGQTRIGDGTLIMTHCHIAHDCQIGNKAIIVTGTALGGHVIVEDRAVLGGKCAVHQFVKIGKIAMIGAGTKVVKDVPPYVTLDGNPARVCGINIIGLRRNGIPPEVRAEIRKAYKLLYRSNLNVSQAIEQINQELESSGEIDHFIRFLRSAERGVSR